MRDKLKFHKLSGATFYDCIMCFCFVFFFCFFFFVFFFFFFFFFLIRKEDNDQESIQLPNTFRSKTPKGKDAVTAPQSKHYKQKAKRTVSSPKNDQTAIQNKIIPKTYMQRHSMTDIVNHSRSTALGICGLFYEAICFSFALCYFVLVFSMLLQFLPPKMTKRLSKIKLSPRHTCKDIQ